MRFIENKLCFVVDDDHFSRRALRNIIDILGYKTVEAENGEEAFTLLENHQPDVIFLDWNMPVMDGLEFLKIANKKNIRDGVKIIFLTGETSNEKILEALEEEPDDYITKPFDGYKIESVLHNVGIRN